MIANSRELAAEVGVESPERIARALYKATTAGVWIKLEPAGVAIGSIVEGSDATIGPERLAYPFAPEAFWQTVESINSQACAEWDLAHNFGEESCNE